MTYIIPALIFVVPLALFIGIVEIWSKFTTRRDRRSPLVRDLLRAPGQSLQEELDDLRMDVLAWLVLVAGAPMFVYASYLQYLLFEKDSQSPVIFGMIACVAGGMWIFALVSMIRFFKRKRILQLGIDAEMAAGQELNQLMHDGYWVFHDLPADKFNIDHVVVGKTGVYAIETKGRSKQLKSGSSGAEVTYDGMTLTFPQWKETKPLKQAKEQATWLGDWLTSAVGERIRAQPVLILLGWFIKKTGPQGIAVLSGREVRPYLSGKRGTELSEKQIQQIRHQLDQRCRNVEPKAYQTTRT